MTLEPLADQPYRRNIASAFRPRRSSSADRSDVRGQRPSASDGVDRGHTRTVLATGLLSSSERGWSDCDMRHAGRSGVEDVRGCGGHCMDATTTAFAPDCFLSRSELLDDRVRDRDRAVAARQPASRPSVLPMASGHRDGGMAGMPRTA